LFSIASILGFLTGMGGVIRDVTARITDLKIAQVNAGTEQEKAKIQAQIDEAHDRRAVLVAEAGSRINAMMRAAIAFGPALYVLKYYAWDKVLGSLVGCAGRTAPGTCQTFITDGLNDQMTTVLTAVIAFYFLYDAVATFRKRS
jgi:hypothetical protein